MISEELYQKYIAELEGFDKIMLWHPKYEDICNDSSHRLMFESIIFNTLKSIQGTVTSSNWKDIRKEYIDYITLRANQTQNLFLKSRYAAIKAVCFKKDTEPAYNTLISFFSAIIRSDIDFPTFNETFDALVKTYIQIKNPSIPTLYQNFTSFLSDISISHENKNILIDDIVRCNVTAFKISNMPNFYSLCESVLENITEKYRRKRLITNMINICDRLINTDKLYAKRKKVLYEQLGDNERLFLLKEDPNNGMVAHLNHHILQNIKMWYKESGNCKKMNEIEQQLIQIKQSRVFPTIQCNIYSEEQKEILNRYFEVVHDFNISEYLSGIANNFFGFLPPHSYILEKSALIKYEDGFEIVKVDVCGNETKINPENLPTYNYFSCYEQIFQSVISNFSEQILDKLSDGSLTYQKVKHLLINETIYGQSYTTMLGFDQTLYEFIELPLRSLFIELKKIVKHKPFNLIVPLETLCLKFERLLREILFIQGIAIISVSAEKEQFILFDKILQYLEDNEIFSVEDINYFRFIFTNDGYFNLRNFAAHGLIDVRYNRTPLGIHSCIALFIAILKVGYNIITVR